MSYKSQQKLRDNITALQAAFTHQPNKVLTKGQVALLKKYSGFGGLKAVLFPNAPKEEWIKLNASKEDLKLYPQIIELHQLLKNSLTEQEYKLTVDSLKNSILTAFYTPPVIPQTLFTVLKEKDIFPKAMYEPSAGAGVFITEAVAAFPELSIITAIEKDYLTGKILQALKEGINVPVAVKIQGFEDSSGSENGRYDLIVSNIPFGNFKVFDDSISDERLKNKIHNYFFAKGLDKIKDGGLLAYITTDTFLNTSSNKPAREYLFNNADFISLNVMPDNLMKDTGNTEAPSHLLIVQKNINKQSISENEQLLIATTEQENEFEIGRAHV